MRFSQAQINRYYASFSKGSKVEKAADFCGLGDFERLAISKALYELAETEMNDLAKASGGPRPSRCRPDRSSSGIQTGRQRYRHALPASVIIRQTKNANGNIVRSKWRSKAFRPGRPCAHVKGIPLLQTKTD
jgi:hypothetical protein